MDREKVWEDIKKDGLNPNGITIKEVKNYSGRLRINITNKDNLNPGDNVVLILESEYNNLLSSNDVLTSKVEMLEHERKNLEDLIEITLNPIHEHYKDQLKEKDRIIKSKDDELNNIKAIMNKFTTSISGLSLWEIIRGKHKNLISECQDKIWVNVPMDQVADVEKLPGGDTE